MATNFPLDPSVGDVFENYEWNGVAWKFIGYEKINTYAPKDSPAITGIASLPATTTIGIITKTELEKLNNISGEIATTAYVQEQITTTLAGVTGGGTVVYNYPTIDTPTGVISMYGGLAAPFGYLLCDGSAISRTAFSGLFAVVGTLYGAGDGSSTFNLPNLKGKVGFGRDTAQTEFDVVGETGGAKTHQHNNPTSGAGGSHVHTIGIGALTSSTDSHAHDAPSHNHSIGHTHDHTHTVSSAGNTDNDSHSHTDTTGSPSGNTTGISSGVSLTAASTSHTHSVSTTSDTHAHGVSVSGTTAGNAAAASPTGSGAPVYTAPVTLATTTDSHSHTSPTVATDTGPEAAHTHTVGATVAASTLPPYQVVNYIIKT